MSTETVAPGYCICGCGSYVGFWERTNASAGAVKGAPKSYYPGHQNYPRLPIDQHFMRNVIWNGDPDECWEWVGYCDPFGYGRFAPKRGEAKYAHRASYELFVGPIPDGLVVDHLCRNPSCVNPKHLEPVTQRENTLRGISPAAVNAVKTHCKHGHEFTLENTRYLPNGHRDCRTCRCEISRRYRARQKGEKQ